MRVRGNHMIAKVLIDNITKNDLICEWGLSFYIEYNGHRYIYFSGYEGGSMVHDPNCCQEESRIW